MYYNTALGYTKLPMKYITSQKDVKYISTETNQPRVIVEDNTFQKDNLYHPNFPVVICQLKIESDLCSWHFYSIIF